MLVACRVVLAGVFAVAGAAKLRDLPGSRRSLSEFGVPDRVVPIAAILLPAVELATAAALIFPGSAQWGALAALLLFLGFIGGIGNALRRGQAPDCHCFGQLHSAPASRAALARNAALGGLAAIVLVDGPGPSISTWVSARTPAELVAVTAVAAALALAAGVVRVWRERRSLRIALEQAQAEIRGLPAGLPVGSMAPSFALSGLDGGIHTLESLRARGRPLLLVFVDPGCGPCHQLLPELGHWQAAVADSLTVAVISQGTADENRPAAKEHGIANLLLQRDSEVMSAYRVSATPAALVVTPEGAIGSWAVGSMMAIEPLVRLTLRRAFAAAPGQARAKTPLP